MNGPSATPTALITGAGRRIGLYLVKTLLEQGYRVYAHYRHSAAELARLQADNSLLTPVQADLLTPTGFTALCDAVSELTTLDLLVNNASLFYRRDPAVISRTDYFAFYQIHVSLPALLTCQLQPQLRSSRGGVVINLLDARADNFRGGFAPYGLSRQAARALTLLQAGELEPQLRVYGLELERLLPESQPGGVEQGVRFDEEQIHENLVLLRTGLQTLLTRRLPTGEILRIAPRRDRRL
ncbi:SDR family NAD(P)-dependent oxidoreductase [bacterium]|nr:SDR family NAD(P)-dependent oxidoreductase [bacterium]